MSFNGGNDNNFPGRIFLPAHVQHLAGLASQEQQLILQRRFAEQAEEQQRRLQMQQFVSVNPNHLVEQHNMRSTLDLYRRRQMQIDIERDLHLRNQIMFEQQMHQHAGVALTQQQHDLLLSPTLARHRQLQQLEALNHNTPGVARQQQHHQHQQLESDALSLQTLSKNKEHSRSRRFSPPDETNSRSRASNSNLQNRAPARKFSDASSKEFSPSTQSPHVSQPDPPHTEVCCSGYQGTSSTERKLTHLEGIADILKKIKQKEIEDRLVEAISKRSASSPQAPNLMESFEDEPSQQERTNNPMIVNSIAEKSYAEETAPFTAEQTEGDQDICLVDSSSCESRKPNQSDESNTITFQKDDEMLSPKEERPARDTRNIAALIATLQQSPLRSSLDFSIDSTPFNDYPPLSTITEADNCEHHSDAELFHLMQHLNEERAPNNKTDITPEKDLEVSAVEDDYEEEDSEVQSEEDAAGDQFEGFNVEDCAANHMSTTAIATVPLVLSKDDPWWPNQKIIQKERRVRCYSASEGHCRGKVPSLPSLAKRLKLDPEQPGLLQKLPYCRIHIKYQQLKGISPQKSVFCSQVTEVHPTEPLVCCSVCVTWRHAACGGHHKWSSSQGTINPKSVFIPLCDLCFQENDVVVDDAELMKALQRQRLKHLRKTLVANQVIRHAAFSKHGGSYKWPLGSVTATHIAGHTRSVNARHEKAEKQWQEMVLKLVNPDSRPRDRMKVRCREFDKLLQHIEDAELCADRHNMILFLQNDVTKDHPVGYEVERSNFFDPLEDPIFEDLGGAEGENDEMSGSKSAPSSEEHDNESRESSSTNSSFMVETSDEENTSMQSATIADRRAVDSFTAGAVMLVAFQQSDNSNNNIPSVDYSNAEECSAADYSDVVDQEEEINDKKAATKVLSVTCARPSCRRKPRHDSFFCSDSCGVSVLECDLLHCLEYSEEMHPSQLR